MSYLTTERVRSVINSSGVAQELSKDAWIVHLGRRSVVYVKLARSRVTLTVPVARDVTSNTDPDAQTKLYAFLFVFGANLRRIRFGIDGANIFLVSEVEAERFSENEFLQLLEEIDYTQKVIAEQEKQFFASGAELVTLQRLPGAPTTPAPPPPPKPSYPWGDDYKEDRESEE